MIFFLILTVRGTFHRKDFKSKKIWGYFLKKTEVLYSEHNKRAEAAKSSCSAACNFLQYIDSMIMAKDHLKMRSRCLVHKFSFKDIFKDINHGLRGATLKKILYGCFHFLWLWLLIAIMKRCAEPCTMQLYCTSLIETRKKENTNNIKISVKSYKNCS